MRMVLNEQFKLGISKSVSLYMNLSSFISTEFNENFSGIDRICLTSFIEDAVSNSNVILLKE